jgi:aspartate carbamoyltransferase catalytic subunit
VAKLVLGKLHKMHNEKPPTNLVSITHLSRERIEQLIAQADVFAENIPTAPLLPHGTVVSLLFFAESTRTCIGFESAAYRLGANVSRLEETKRHGRMSSAETVEDTVRVINDYADALVIRHNDANIFLRVAPSITKPLINAGNGDDEHPTQALIDLMTIQAQLGNIDNISISLVGDLRFSRATHSLLLALSKFKNITAFCGSPKELAIPDQYKSIFVSSGNTLIETEKPQLKDTDVVYVAGFTPNTPAGTYEDYIRNRYQINGATLEQLDPKAIILCPLPRIDEITTDVDTSRHAQYFTQSKLGLFMRMAILYDSLKSA